MARILVLCRKRDFCPQTGCGSYFWPTSLASHAQAAISTRLRAFTTLVAIAVGLLFLTMLIAVVGVGSTTALSVLERTRESGLLRAIGLTRKELGRLVTVEAGLYGIIGAVLGLAIGVPYAWLAIISLGVEWPLQVPVFSVGVVVLVLAALTAGAGLLPARRAARVSPVAALHSIQ